MIVYGADLAQVTAIVGKVSAEHYAGNIEIRTGEDRSNSRGGRCTFTLRATDTAGEGAKGSASWSSSGTGPNGLRRTVAACWHAHYDVLAALFRDYPDARVNTAMARYTAGTFHDAAMATLARNVGALARNVGALARNVGALALPRFPDDLCACDHFGWEDRTEDERDAVNGR